MRWCWLLFPILLGLLVVGGCNPGTGPKGRLLVETNLPPGSTLSLAVLTVKQGLQTIQQATVSPKGEAVFTHLEPGEYQLIFSDAKGAPPVISAPIGVLAGENRVRFEYSPP